MKMPFLLIRRKIMLKCLLIKKGGCFEYNAVIRKDIRFIDSHYKDLFRMFDSFATIDAVVVFPVPGEPVITIILP